MLTAAISKTVKSHAHMRSMSEDRLLLPLLKGPKEPPVIPPTSTYSPFQSLKD